ncbi:MAG: 4Fe-4S dicluster domain-containing protein [bacterium]
MCRFCIEHGEGRKWYLQMKNYSDDLERSGFRREAATAGTVMFDGIFARGTRYMGLLEAFPALKKYVSGSVAAFMRSEHFGQVVPVEDAARILELADPITLVPCVCKKAFGGRMDAVHCIGFGYFPRGFLGWFPEFGARMKPADRETALAVIAERRARGAVNTVWTYRTPYVGKMCNCDVPECAGFQFRSRCGARTVYKSEYVFAVDAAACAGCRACEARCQFGAITFDARRGTSRIDRALCFGCGNCRDACAHGAIIMNERPPTAAWTEL